MRERKRKRERERQFCHENETHTIEGEREAVLSRERAHL